MSDDKHALINPKRDMSNGAIRERYDKANLIAITSHNRILCESLADNFYLLNLLEKIQKKEDNIIDE